MSYIPIPRQALRSAQALLEGRWGTLFSLVLIFLLLAAVLVLPPVSAIQRWQARDYVRTFPGVPMQLSDGTRLLLPESAPRSPTLLRFESVPRADLLEGSVTDPDLRLAMAALPPQLVLKSPLYLARTLGPQPESSEWTIPIPPDAEPHTLLDLYQWDGNSWSWLPHQRHPVTGTLAARWDAVPGAVAVMQAQRAIPSISVEVREAVPLGDPAKPLVRVFSPRLYLMNGDGSIGQLFPMPPDLVGAPTVMMPVLHNQQPDGVIRSDLVANLLIDPALWQRHIDQIVTLVVGTPYDGLVLDYANLDAAARGDFSTFVTELARRLHEKGKLLVVQVGAPTVGADGSFETGGYDWEAIGRAADVVRLPLPDDPRMRLPHADGALAGLLGWAVGQVNRYKLEVLIPTASYDLAEAESRPVSYERALAAMGTIIVQEGRNRLSAGEQATLQLPALQAENGFGYDEAVGAYHFSFTDAQGTPRTVYLQNAASLADTLKLLASFHLGGIALRDPDKADARLWQLVGEYQRAGLALALPNRLSVVWRVQNERGEPIGGEVRSIAASNFVFTAPPAQGVYQVSAVLSDDGGATTYGTPQVQTLIVPTFTPFPVTPPSFPTPPTGPVTGTVTPVPGLPTPTLGPDLSATPEAGLAETPEPALGAAAAPTEAPSAAPSNQPVAAVVPAIQAGPPLDTLRYGIQAHMIHQDKQAVVNSTAGLGFGWLKQQIEWRVFEPASGEIQWGEMDAILEAATPRGISLLFSIVKAPAWARPAGFDPSVEGPPADPQSYARFVGAVAKRYCGKGLGAIEVWNEQNLHYEWGNQPLRAGDYLALLRPAYGAIKAACPSMIVVSGALTPAGNVSTLARDDIEYLNEMYAAGLAEVSDAIGAHPSGYNCSAEGDWRTISDPGASFKGPFNNRHHSWCFRGTMEGYRAVMMANGDARKTIWATEFGWAVGPAVSDNYGYANDNTIEEQAAWTVRAYGMARSWGWVGAMFLWNLNFKVVASGSETAQWGIVAPDWTPSPTYHALAAMPK